MPEHEKKKSHRKVAKSNKDDLSGMFVNMGSHIDIREVFILWIVFIFVHTEMFAEYFLKRFSGATNDDCTPTMKGTFIGSLVMVLAVIVCSLIF
jgi:ABC-type phosphate transport system permease subunit